MTAERPIIGDARVTAARQYVTTERPRFDVLLPSRVLTSMFYELRAHTLALLDVIAGRPPLPGEPTSPSVYACHGAKWAITRRGSLWSAEWTEGTALRLIVAHDEAGLIVKLDRVEAKDGSQSV